MPRKVDRTDVAELDHVLDDADELEK